ncbi:MAG: helix-turn-helix transcriptional regulator [Paludibacteraceae bacterium]|nr:helix-turn-helix transcriptional regulator [Clostridiales bacterium]MBP5424005.1 helix-turn-helix transcriptional regulator [Paludibacteraceae bacterium]
MTGEFGKFVECKRKEVNLTLRGLASKLGIAPAYMSDIEKGHRYPPELEKLELLVEILELSKEDEERLYDLAASERDNAVSPDLRNYIMGTQKARVALRIARDNNVPESAWQKVIDMLEEQAKKS